KVRSEIERASSLTVVVLDGANDVDLVAVSAGCHQPGYYGVGGVVFCGQDNDAAHWSLPFLAGPISPCRNPGSDISAQLALAETWLATDQRQLADGDPSLPQPIDRD